MKSYFLVWALNWLEFVYYSVYLCRQVNISIIRVSKRTKKTNDLYS